MKNRLEKQLQMPIPEVQTDAERIGTLDEILSYVNLLLIAIGEGHPAQGQLSDSWYTCYRAVKILKAQQALTLTDNSGLPDSEKAGKDQN